MTFKTKPVIEILEESNFKCKIYFKMNILKWKFFLLKPFIFEKLDPLTLLVVAIKTDKDSNDQ